MEEEPAMYIPAQPDPVRQVYSSPAFLERKDQIFHARYESAHDIYEEDVILRLRAILHDEAAVWKSVAQRDAFIALMQMEKDVIMGMRTGSGKSADVVLAAEMTQGITVLVVPYLALKHDWVRRLKKMEVHFQVFDSVAETPKPQPLHMENGIILVSADVAAWARFTQALRDLVGQGMIIARIVYDEAHAYISEKGFRPSLRFPFKLRSRFPCQVVLMSGTFPPQATDWAISNFVLTTPIVIRMNSSRKEAFFVMDQGRYEGINLSNALTKWLKSPTIDVDNFDAQDRWIAFVPFVKGGHERAKELGVEFYHAPKNGRDATGKGNEQILSRFLNGTTKGLLASTALTAGMDFPSVRAVIHLGDPYSMMSFVQEVGRGGRDGKQFTSLILRFSDRKSAQTKGADTEEGHLQGIDAMTHYLQGHHNDPKKPADSCWRNYQSQVLDGITKTSCFSYQPDIVLCEGESI